MDEHVLRGNTAILKCHIPSFVSDFVAVDAWIDDEGAEYYPNKHFGINFKILLMILLIVSGKGFVEIRYFLI